MSRLSRSTPSSQNRRERSLLILSGRRQRLCFLLAGVRVAVLVYGSNTLFFLLYARPFFTALMPLSVLIGITLSMLLRGRLILTLLLTGAIVLCLFWLVFSFLTGW